MVRFISTLNLNKGYWQINLTLSAQENTAFSTHSGHWQYTALSFSLHGTSTTFQQMMDLHVWGRGNASEEPPDHIHNSLIKRPHNTDSGRRPQRECKNAIFLSNLIFSKALTKKPLCLLLKLTTDAGNNGAFSHHLCTLEFTLLSLQ